MNQFSRDLFLAASGDERRRLCLELGAVLHVRLATMPEFHTAIGELVSELRELGHDLWSFDASDEMEAWCPNYQVSSGPGIVVTFRVAHVDVEWSEK